MNNKYYILFVLIALLFGASINELKGQESLNIVDSLMQVAAKKSKDSLILDSIMKAQIIEKKMNISNTKTFYFYLATGFLLIFATLKSLFNKYFMGLFQVFFNSSLKQTQIADQMKQNNLPSLIFNIFFILTISFFGGLAYLKFNAGISLQEAIKIFSLLLLLFMGIYIIRWVVLLFIGWVTSEKELINQYIFQIFLSNKLVGVFLIIPIVFLALLPLNQIQFFFKLGLVVIALFFVFRSVKSFISLRKSIKLSVAHFFIYLIAIEVLPLLLLYKLLIYYSNKMN